MRTAFISGRLGADPQLFTPTSGEYSAVKFSIANNDESHKTQSGEWENITNWFDIVYWTRKPQEWLRKLTKGSEVCIECDIKQERWEKDGQQRSKITFNVKRGTFPIVTQQSGNRTEPTASHQDQSFSFDDIPF